MGVDPFQFGPQLLGRVHDGTKDAHAPSTADSRHNIAAMAESKQGKFDAKLATQI
ncbi:MAG: hypothetical protein FalmKO_40030 [Falsiruegeria mediterranea]